MTRVYIKFAPAYTILLDAGDLGKVRARLGNYAEYSRPFNVEGEGEDAAEEAFDLTNNPSRQEEREQKYGNGQGISTGDIVVVGEEQWVCMSFGWAKL